MPSPHALVVGSRIPRHGPARVTLLGANKPFPVSWDKGIISMVYPLWAEESLMVDKVLVVRAEHGEIKESQVVEGDILQVVREIARQALEEWDPAASDYVIVKDKYEVSVKLPLTKEQFERYSKYGLRRGQGVASFDIPVYMVSFSNEWQGDSYRDKKIYLVTIYVDESVENEIKEFAAETTRGEG